MSVDVSKKALAASSRAHAAASEALEDNSSVSAALLLFYAVECALKHEVIVNHSLRGTADLSDEHKHHDLRRLAKELKLGADLSPHETYRAHETKQGPPSIPIAGLHEAWRYGMRLHPDAQKEAVMMLRNLVRWSRSRSA